MPELDGTGPSGAGLLTGRGVGFCENHKRTRFFNQIQDVRDMYGLGYRGRGRGWRYRFYATSVPGWTPITPEQEINELNALVNQLKAQLDAIQKRIDELNT